MRAPGAIHGIGQSPLLAALALLCLVAIISVSLPYSLLEGKLPRPGQAWVLPTPVCPRETMLREELAVQLNLLVAYLGCKRVFLLGWEVDSA